MAAAPLDYELAKESQNKIKKELSKNLKLELVPSIDILKSLYKNLNSMQRPLLTIGFAAETEHIEDFARKKLDR